MWCTKISSEHHFFISICAEFLFESLEYIGVDMKKISIFAKNIGF